MTPQEIKNIIDTNNCNILSAHEKVVEIKQSIDEYEKFIENRSKENEDLRKQLEELKPEVGDVLYYVPTGQKVLICSGGVGGKTGNYFGVYVDSIDHAGHVVGLQMFITIEKFLNHINYPSINWKLRKNGEFY
jgi:hypothetical protein